MTQADIKRMMKYVAKTFNIPILNEIIDAESDSALTVRSTYNTWLLKFRYYNWVQRF